MTYPDPQALRQAEQVAAIVRALEVVPPEEAATVLRDEVRRRAAALTAFARTAPESQAQLTEVDVERVVQLVGTTRTALHLIAAAIVELGATPASIADTVQWMELRPVGLQGTQQHLGVDIGYIIAYQALTRSQKWLLHTLAAWAEPPATIERAAAIFVAEQSGTLQGLPVTDEDLSRLEALALVNVADLPTDQTTRRSSLVARRIAIEPYIRVIAGSGLAGWRLPEHMPDLLSRLEAPELVAATVADWAVQFATIIAGPDLTPHAEREPDAEEEDDDDEDDGPGLTPDPDLAPLTDDEIWLALEPEAEQVVQAARYARQLGAHEHVYQLCQLLMPPLRRIGTPAARAVLRPLLETGLLAARSSGAARETVLLASQLADVELDDGNLDRAELFADEALQAALSQRDMPAIGFTTRRSAALAIRMRHTDRALERARQAVRLARASGDRAALNESIALLHAATKLKES
jgi:hypothetical protein